MGCIFGQRGTLIKDVGHLSATAQVELLPRAADAVKKLNSSQYLALVVTNQPVLARGDALNGNLINPCKIRL